MDALCKSMEADLEGRRQIELSCKRHASATCATQVGVGPPLKGNVSGWPYEIIWIAVPIVIRSLRYFSVYALDVRGGLMDRIVVIRLHRSVHLVKVAHHRCYMRDHFGGDARRLILLLPDRHDIAPKLLNRFDLRYQ